MSFLNAALLGGVLAFLAPLLIHLLNRTRFRKVEWGAMHLLESAMEVNSKRIQWESWLLLLVRCCIPILFAMCLARPVLTAMRVSGAAGEKALVFVLDDSLSMGAVRNASQSEESNTKTLWNSVCEEVLRIAAENPGAEKRLLLTSGDRLAPSEASLDTQALAKVLQSTEPQAGVTTTWESVERGLAMLVEMPSPNKHLVLASDFREADWNGAKAELQEATLARIRERLQASTLPVQLTLLSVQPDAPQDNVAIRFGDPQDYQVPLGQLKLLPVVVERHGEFQDRADFEVTVTVDGRPLASQLVSLDGDASEVLRFECDFGSAGWHAVTATVESKVGIPGDDQAGLVVQVHEPLRILRVREKPQSRNRVGRIRNVDILELAFMPFRGEQQSRNAFQVQTIEPRALAANLEQPPALVVLDGVSQLDSQAQEMLPAYVAEGGGLLVLAGTQLQTDWYRHAWEADSNLLPFSFEALEIGSRGLMREELLEPALTVFNSDEAGDLYEIEFEKWMPLASRSERVLGTEAAQSHAVLRFEDGSPCVVSREFGLGHVVQCAFSLEEGWSNLPQKPVVVPLVQQLAWMVTQSDQVPNVMAGNPLHFNYEPKEGADFRGQELVFRNRAGGRDLRVELSEAAESTLHPIRPGVYRAAEQVATIKPAMFAAMADPAESQVRLLSTNELADFAEELGGVVVRGADEFSREAELRENGREIWPWFLVGLLVLLFAEILLGRTITQGTMR